MIAKRAIAWAIFVNVTGKHRTFRQFLLRGLPGARGKRLLVTMAWNIRRMAALLKSLVGA